MSAVSAQFKKQDGRLAVTSDGKTVSWRAVAGSGAVDISIVEITNLQQTPVTAANASVKIVLHNSAEKKDSYTFTFTSSAARDDQQATTGALRKHIEAAKALDEPPPQHATPAPDSGAVSASMAIAQTVVGGAATSDDAYNDAKLLADIELQRSLLNSNPALRQRFDQSLRDKPEAISIVQFSNQFWATRVHLLRSHAAEKSQGTGTYNVLSVVKPRNEGGEFKLNMSKEQIQLIFHQHPIVKKVYNENVPRLSEVDFWSRFFASRLVKKLRGEKITENDATDPKLDAYLNIDYDADVRQDSSVPNFLDVEGNEQNHSQRQGNRPDYTMRPNAHEKVPILRTLNQMSGKMMADVPPSEGFQHGPAGMDEETYQQLQLRDLQQAADDNRVVLNIQDQSRFFSAEQGVHTSTSAATYAKRTPAQILSVMQQEIEALPSDRGQSNGIDLRAAIGTHDDSSSDEETTSERKSRVGSKSSRVAATLQVTDAIRKRHRHDNDYLPAQTAPSAEQAAQLGLSERVFENLVMTHNTTVEFLHYFWAVYHSGDADRAGEVARLIDTLDKSLDRIQAVVDAAEAERAAIVEAHKKQIELLAQRTKKRRKFDENSIKGGGKVAAEVVGPLVRAIHAARSEYQEKLQEQMSSNGHSREP